MQAVAESVDSDADDDVIAAETHARRAKLKTPIKDEQQLDDAAAASTTLSPGLLLCAQVLRGIMRRRESQAAFNEPVDPVEQDIPHYNLVVKTPMDLGTVKQRLLSGYYNAGNTSAADGDAPMEAASSTYAHSAVWFFD